MVGYVRRSETERVSVSNDRLATLNMLKIQSGPLGNLGDQFWCTSIRIMSGDEMNIHLAQSIQARNELERIANVKYNIISAKDSNPIIGCVQDPLVGAYVLTRDDNMLDYHLVSNILCGTTSPYKYQVKRGNQLVDTSYFPTLFQRNQCYQKRFSN